MGDFDYVKIVLEELAATRPGSGVRVVAGRDQAGQAARVRHARRACPCSGCPATRCRRGSASSCSPGRRCGALAGRSDVAASRSSARPRRTAFAPPARRQAPPRPGARSSSRTVATCASGPGSRRATCSRAWPRRPGWPCIPDGAGRRRPAARSRSLAALGRVRPRVAQKVLARCFTERGTTCTLRRAVAGRASRGSQRRLRRRVAARGRVAGRVLRHPERLELSAEVGRCAGREPERTRLRGATALAVGLPLSGAASPAGSPQLLATRPSARPSRSSSGSAFRTP